MMQAHWIDGEGFCPRGIVVVEDHAFHIDEMLQIEALTPWLPHLTFVCLDRGGPDTTASVKRWLDSDSFLQIAALAELEHPRFHRLEPEIFERQNLFTKSLATLVRPGALLIQDIQLETLSFIGAELWWESIYLAGAVRGTMPDRPPVVSFMSNKSGFGISFGKELLEAGFDPRRVIDKNRLARYLPEVVASHMQRAVPLELAVVQGDKEPHLTRVAPADQEEIAGRCDLLLWLDEQGGCSLEGKQVRKPTRPREAEAETWRKLFDDRLQAGGGISIDALGARLAPEGALRAERSNTAARHIHNLRARLADGTVIQTDAGVYRLGPALRLGLCRPVPD